MAMIISGSEGVSRNSTDWALTNQTKFSSVGALLKTVYAPSQGMGRIAYTGGGAATVFDTTCCPANYTTVSGNSQLLWFISVTGSCDITHVSMTAQFSVNGGTWTNCQSFSGVSGAFTLTWQSNANNTDTHGSVACIPYGSYPAGASIAFRMAMTSPQQYEMYLGGSDSDWSSFRYARGQHILMETLV